MTKRSGTVWTEADYRARGYGTVKLRLPLDTLEMLAREAHDSGLSRAELVDEMIRIDLDPTHPSYAGPVARRRR
ncbi:orf omegA-bindinG-regulatory protein compleX [Caudoviricetes sp.]|nr:orf omegA-bindinG-regulatory protein compleX [Caudoviricetes sp.]